jgi:Leucine-rich repeat (LRR) protein
LALHNNFTYFIDFAAVNLHIAGLELIDADLTPMATSLRSLSLAGNRLRDVRPLAVLSGLEELVLADNEM